LKIVTFNIWGTFGPEVDKRWAYAGDCLAKLNPDILCLQEATEPRWLIDISRKTGLEIVQADCDSTGLAFLTRLVVHDFGLIPYAQQSPVENYYRKFQWHRVIAGKKSFSIFNTHLSWKPKDDASRARQAQQLLENANRAGEPTMLCGDFNCEYNSIPLSVIRDEGYKDSLESTSDRAKPTWDNANPFIQSHTVKFPDRRVDLMLLSDAFQREFPLAQSRIVLNESDSDGNYPSDHYGVEGIFN
jgi:endonuclease/exonuclease/phosphatase family metal-dependent hydrolase